MNKIKILVIANDFNGVGYYRITSPYLSLSDEQLDIKFLSTTDFTFKFNEENLKDFNIIVYHKTLPLRTKEDADNFIAIKNKYNFKLVVDVDDYWVLNEHHPNFATNDLNNRIARLENNIKLADYVTTTTTYLADIISEFNVNIIILENAINTKEQQWIPNKKESDKTRFLWGGGVTHLYDLKLLEESMSSMDKDLIDKIQIYLCGFDLRMKDKNNNFVISNPEKNPWTYFERIMTNNYKSIYNKGYTEWLLKYLDGEDLYGYNVDFKDEFYQRRWSKPIFDYGEMYNDADVALAPLLNNKFNNAKSQLKVIEAGIHKCPIIASNNSPYTIDVIDGKHGFLIDDNDKMGWYNKIKYFTENPNAVKDMGEALNELVLEKYTLEKVNQKRIDFFKSIL